MSNTDRLDVPLALRLARIARDPQSLQSEAAAAIEAEIRPLVDALERLEWMVESAKPGLRHPVGLALDNLYNAQRVARQALASVKGGAR